MTKYGNGAKPERKRRMKADIKEDFDENMLGYDEAYEDMLEDGDSDVYLDEESDAPYLNDMEEVMSTGYIKEKEEKIESVSDDMTTDDDDTSQEIRTDTEFLVGSQKKGEISDEINSMTLKDYLKYKKDQYIDDFGEDEDGWNKLRSQINSAVMLGLTLAKIEIFAQGSLDYEQREILKYALYESKIDTKDLKDMAEKRYTADVLRVKVNDKKIDVKMNEELSAPLRILSDSISAYKLDIDGYKQQSENRIKEIEEKLRSAEQERDNLKDQLESERRENQEKLRLIREREQREREKKEFDARVEKAAQEKFARMQLEETANRERMEIERRKIEDEFQSKHRRGFWKKRKIEPEKARKSIPLSAVEQLPPGFNLTAYIMSAGLSAGQMDVISLAVRSKVDDSIIKAMIDQQLPAAQMKQLLAVVLARGHQGNSMREEDIRYDEITYIED